MRGDADARQARRGNGPGSTGDQCWSFTCDATPPPPPPAVPAPVTVAQEAYADPTGKHAVIVDFVTQNVTNLMNDGNSAAQSAARNNLISAAVNLVNGAAPSPAFMLDYGKALNDTFLPKLDPKANSTVRQRLNIAIVTARVAWVADNVTLVP